MKHTAQKFVLAFLREESGQDLIEYALIAACVSLGAVASMNNLASSIGTAFSNVNTTLNSSL